MDFAPNDTTVIFRYGEIGMNAPSFDDQEFSRRLRAKWAEIQAEPVPGLEGMPAYTEQEIIDLHRSMDMKTPSTTQSVIDDMADLVMTAPGERVAMLNLLHQAIQDRMVTAGMSDEQKYDFWTEVFYSIKSFALFGVPPNGR